MAPEGQAADVIKLKFNNYFPATHFVSTFSAQFCDEVKKRTNGQVEISHFAGGTLTPPPRVFDGVVQGISDLGMTTLGYTRGRFPVLEILELPFGYTSGWVASSVANDFYRTFKPKEFDSVHVLFFHCVGPLAVSTVKKPVNTLEELKGLKIRAISRYADMMKYLGASPVPLEIGDIYEALRRGTLDGTLVTLEGLKGFRLGEIIRYATATSKTGGSGGISVVMNKGKWDSLPADIKKVFDDLSAEFSEKYAVQWNQTDIDGREFLKSQGGTVIYLTDAEAAKWTQALQPVVLDYKNGLMAKGYSEKEIDGYISFMKERIGYWRKMEKERKIPTPYE
jgi:TRAP-type C4-dicarboxylate transport system substrate-binding protein